MGSPPASGLASVMMSGDTPYTVWPHSSPVRPRPHCTSSYTNSAPASSHSLRRPARNSGVAGVQPPSPCTGSTNTAHVTPFLMTAAAEARSLYVASAVPGMTGRKGVLYCSLYVSASAPIVRPWKQFVKDTISEGAEAAPS